MCQCLHFDTTIKAYFTYAKCKVFVLGIKSNAQGHTFFQPGKSPALAAACHSKNHGALELIYQGVISPSIWLHFQKI